MTYPLHVLLLRNADVYAPRPLGLSSLLLGGGKILWMGSAQEPIDLPRPLRAGLEVIDLEGARLIPGLVDGHVHVTGGGGEGGFRTRVPPVPLSRLTANGITTAIAVLGTDDVARSTRELLACIQGLREEGLNVWGLTGGYHVPPATLTGTVRGDIVFVESLIGIGEVAISDHRSSQPTLDELLRLASEAHVAGLMSGKAGILHLHVGDGARGLDLIRRALAGSEIPPRVFNPTHVNRRRGLFEEALDLARRGCTIDLTAFPVAEDEDAYTAADALLRYVDKGGPPERITISSDAGGCLACFDPDGRLCSMETGSAGALLQTLREVVDRGLALDVALAAFTSNPARLLRLAGKGAIAAGSDADLVALDATGQARTVIINGVVHVSAGRILRPGTFENQGDRGA